ncbi:MULTISPECIES: DUF262 domain-containing protein [Vibrio]|uniref:DUF262 domain-containing protein n=1 Tax=Vibrio TaxID=662 RepID=UPI002074BE99|nr:MULTISPECIES: DUF262 domain-containing protein [Vibrio]USD35463.1 DUF262 domain-containing protein [Vibrio sp. SCSIO 43186]USD72587.1 DUF262 domain-containing protein [Vibrio sp. SCSIO 43139]USD98980.1 hypothetical protein CTT30_23185 [Vibrio coralliilyticus]
MNMPQPIIHTRLMQSDIEEVLRTAGYDQKDYPWAVRFVGRFPVPKWQRDLCWSREQKIKLIESIWLGFDIGSYIVNEWDMEGNVLVENSDIVIDGQQRIEAICAYALNDEFSVFGKRYSELNKREQARFKKTSFPKRITHTFNEDALKETYNRLNFGGTQHKPEQRA